MVERMNGIVAECSNPECYICETLRAAASQLSGVVGERDRLREALEPFAFLSRPDAFLSADGGCTEAIIEDADVQRVRAALNKTGGQS